jgi:hypothetical protein
MERKKIVEGGGLSTGLLFALLCIAPTQGWAGTMEEFLLVEHPDRLLILNRYQQNLVHEDATALEPFSPLRVLKSRDLLGDGFTPCMRVEIDGVDFFLIRERDGRLVGETRAGLVRSHSGELLPRDTLHVLKGGALQIAPPEGQGGHFLGAGDRIIRLFFSDGRTYVKCPGHSPAYGWVTLLPGMANIQWGMTRAVSSVESLIPPSIRDSVQTALTRANAVIASLFSFFNTHSGQDRRAPQWRLDVAQSSLVCTLLNGSPERDFPESTRYLAKDLQNFVLGTEFAVFRSPGTIEIRPKQ